ncbi:MAG TPA: RND transporter [Chromatiales bacterium]|nr:RND transporter [Thiotrichales bacterium]HIP67213.1 RND transporter [Chromatiales bacterium]
MGTLLRNALSRPKTVLWLAAIFCLIMIALVAAPSISPGAFPYLQPLKIDTDPENMLDSSEPVRVFHNQMKNEFALHDLVVVGIINKTHQNGVFNPRTLKNIVELTEFAKTLRWKNKNVIKGVIGIDLITPSTVDNIEQVSPGTVRFDWLLPGPPTTEQEALAVREKAARIPMLNDTVVSGDGQAIALYIPITAKDVSYRVSQELRKKIAGFDDGATYYITGLPIAQDQFGIDMFKQMAISAPLAMLLIFFLMWLFFKHLNLVISPMIVAMASVIGAMGLLVITGNTVHIMSSMIPIFIMPIAVLDAVHLLSEFYDRYPQTRDRKKAIQQSMKELWTPMLFTTLTTCAGFASLMLTPIPPVQVFGLFVAIGVFLAWLFTITLIPAYIMLMPKTAFENFGHPDCISVVGASRTHKVSSCFLQAVGQLSHLRARPILVILAALLTGTVYGIHKIIINDNPVKWFSADHEIRVADKALNEKFAGTYMAYLVLEPETPTTEKLFTRPDMLRFIEALQTHLNKTGLVGKSNALPDVVKTIHRELLGEASAFRIPDSQAAVAQTLLTFESSHRPQDLYKLVTPDYQKANVWIQLKSGDNVDMNAVVEAVDQFMQSHAAPVALRHNWFGLTYINVIWQEKMVSGMLVAFLSSFAVVLVLMVLLFRSFAWGLLSMVPLTATISMIYGIIGWVGKDYDMPIAVLSSLSLGLAIDYAIHFNARSRQIFSRLDNWTDTVKAVFSEPARAISRNMIIIGVGFLPLLAAPLVPYQTVGIFISSILVMAGFATLLGLPALITLLQRFLFITEDKS